jgi:hypothetical protein
MGSDQIVGLVRSHVYCSGLGAMPTLAVGIFSRENHRMATLAWPWHRYTTVDAL